MAAVDEDTSHPSGVNGRCLHNACLEGTWVNTVGVVARVNDSKLYWQNDLTKESVSMEVKGLVVRTVIDGLFVEGLVSADGTGIAWDFGDRWYRSTPSSAHDPASQPVAIKSVEAPPKASRYNWQSALHVLGASRGGLPPKRSGPTASSYGATISVCARCSQWQMALDLMREMPLRKIEADVLTYNTVISACEKSDRWREALDLLNEMRSKGMEPTDEQLQEPSQISRRRPRSPQEVEVTDATAQSTTCDSGDGQRKAVEVLQSERRRSRISFWALIFVVLVELLILLLDKVGLS